MDLALPACINSFNKLNYWINFCNNIENYKYFLQYILVPDSKHLYPSNLIALFDLISCTVKGKFPHLSEDIEISNQALRRCVIKVHVRELNKNSLQK